MKEHPIQYYQQQMEEEGLVVLSQIPNILTNNETFVFPGLIICINLQGWFKVEYDMKVFDFKCHDVSVLQPNHMVCIRDASQDSRTMFIMISPSLLREIVQDIPELYYDGLSYNWNPLFHLQDNQFECIVCLLETLKKVNQTTLHTHTYLIKQLVGSLSLMLKEFKAANGVPAHQPSLHEKLFFQFYETITKHFRDSREVRFYADKLCLSPKYFSIAIKKQTGINALAWIKNYVTLQAKRELYSHRDLPILQIAFSLGFPDQPSFSKFFKHETGLSPTQFRNRS